MADKTNGFNAGEEFYEKGKLVIEESGLLNKELFARTFAFDQTDAIKEWGANTSKIRLY